MISTRDIDALATASGVELAQVIDRVTGWVEVLTDGQRLELVKATARLEAWAVAGRGAAIAELFDSAWAQSQEISEELTAAKGPVQGSAKGSALGWSAAGLSHGFDDAVLVCRQVGTEVAFKLGVSAGVAGRELDLALDLRRWPVLGEALRVGRIDRAQAMVIAQELGTLDDPMHRVALLTSVLGPDETFDGDQDAATDLDTWQGMDGVDPRLVDAASRVDPVRELDCEDPEAVLWGTPGSRLRTILRREVARLDAEAAQERAVQARADRRVWVDSRPDFMAEVFIRTTGEAAAAAYRNLDATARAAKKAGAAGTLEQLRSDIATGWLTEGTFGLHITRPAPADRAGAGAGMERTDQGGRGAPARDEASLRLLARSDRPCSDRPCSGDQASRPPVCLPPPSGPQIIVTVAATTMLGLDQEPGILHGPGGPVPIPATIARDIAHDPKVRTWNRLLYDPATGIATDYTPGYRPPPRLADYVRARDGHMTRSPISCATHLELDHVVPYRSPDSGDSSRGGRTTAANLAALGQRDHHLKTDTRLIITGDANGTLRLTTPSGATYHSQPYRYADPRPPRGDPPF